MPRGTEFIKTVLNNVIQTQNFGHVLKKLDIVSAGSGKCKAQLVVSEEHLNLFGSMHGGFTSTLVDCVSTYALMTQGGGEPGVSVNLQVTFMKPAFPGDVVTIDAKAVSVGKRIAFLAVDITKDGGLVMIAQGQHTKFLL